VQSVLQRVARQQLALFSIAQKEVRGWTVNVGIMIVTDNILTMHEVMNPIQRYVLVCLLLLLIGCSESITQDSSEICENGYSKIVAEFKDNSLSHERRENLIARLSELTSNCPKHVGLKILMADAQVSIGNNISALAYITSALEIEPTNAEALHVKGSILFMEGQNEEAITLLKRSVVLDPANVEFLTNLCSTWESTENYAAAVESCSKAIQLTNEAPPPVLYYMRGRAYEALGNIRESENDYRKAKELGFDMWPE
jgi:Flp pilus assembly protein TadD